MHHQFVSPRLVILFLAWVCSWFVTVSFDVCANTNFIVITPKEQTGAESIVDQLEHLPGAVLLQNLVLKTRLLRCRPSLFGTLHQWCVKFLSRIFYPFWPPYGQKFRFGTFDQDVSSWYSWLWCGQKLCSVLSTMVRVFRYFGTLTSGTTNGGLRYEGKFSPIRDCVFLFILKNL